MHRTISKHAVSLIIGALLGVALYLYSPLLMRTGSDEPPQNFVVIREHLATSGQPSPEQLQQLAVDGYQLVINLAPPDAFGSLPEEGYIVAANGISYVNIPVDWDRPQAEDYRLFSDILSNSGGRKVLVHCQTNKRASLFTFLYRVLNEGAAQDEAIEAVHRIWVPEEHWQTFIRSILSAQGMDYDIL
jgi:protein tyrosine phosphatase (PTP) superfamily phosphohydrolase (DUF442 family)